MDDDEIEVAETGPDFLLATLDKCLNKAQYADVQLTCAQGRKVMAHRPILAAVSPYLRDIFKHADMAEEAFLYVDLPESLAEDVKVFLKLAYTGEVKCEGKHRKGVWALMKTLKVTPDVVEYFGSSYEKTDKDIHSSITLGSTVSYGGVSLTKVTKGNPKTGLGQKRSGVHVEVGLTTSGVKKPRKLPDMGPQVTLEPVIKRESSNGQEEDLVLKLADEKTRDILERTSNASETNAFGRKCEKCQCPNCMDPEKTDRGDIAFHVCHYPLCAKKYKKTSHLRAHLRWHIGDQPYMCSWHNCGKKFTRSDELHRHYRIHTGEKNHHCPMCEKCFSRSDHLKKHMTSHASEGLALPLPVEFLEVSHD